MSPKGTSISTVGSDGGSESDGRGRAESGTESDGSGGDAGEERGAQRRYPPAYMALTIFASWALPPAGPDFSRWRD